MPRELTLFADSALFLGLEQLPTQQNVNTGFSKLFSNQIGLKYTNTTRSLGSVDHEKGVRARVVAGLDTALGDFYPKLAAGFDYGVPLPWRNASLWIYTAAATSWGREESSLGNFFLGSFGNNYVDNREVKRYREEESFPGFEIGEISARRLCQGSGRMNLPPWVSRYRDAELFPELGAAACRGVPRGRWRLVASHNYQKVGGQRDWNLTAMSRLPITFSIGGAAGFRDGHYQARKP